MGKKNDSQWEEVLTDNRGHYKTDKEVDELERLRRENLRLKRQLEEKDMLAELLIKVQDIYSLNRVHRIMKNLGYIQ